LRADRWRKTEAAFYPSFQNLLQIRSHRCSDYVGPLKALINDQFRRWRTLRQDGNTRSPLAWRRAGEPRKKALRENMRYPPHNAGIVGTPICIKLAAMPKAER